MRNPARVALTVSVMGTAAAAARPDFPEVEPNETKAQATAAALGAGDALTGNTTGASTTIPGPGSADMFLVRTAPLPPGIYRHRLVLTTTGTEGHTGTIRGLNQVGGVIGTADTVIQTSSAATSPARFNQWYGFGKEERVYYRIVGTAATTDDYRATHQVQPVTPADIGSFQAGQIMITTAAQGHTTDTDLWVYDSAFTAIATYGNDDEPGGATRQSRLTRAYTPGVYYVALTSFNFSNHLATPSDDAYRDGAVLDFADAATNSITTLNQDVSFAVTDGAGTTQFPAIRPGPFDIVWFRFTVGGGTGCYVNCDSSTIVPCLNVNDFVCFNNRFNAGSSYANCDASTIAPVLNVNDFICFNNRFGAGCANPCTAP